MSYAEKIPSLVNAFQAVRIIPVLALETVSSGLKMCELLAKNGLPAAEITFRTAAAEETIRQAAKEFPQLLLGAGTVLNKDTLSRAIDAGASFAVAPGFNPTVVKAAIAQDFPFLPGVATPSEIEQAFELGCTLLKFFPAEANGGVKMIQNYLGPYRHLGIRFMPTGGVKPENVESYLAVPEIACVGGTWLAKTSQIREAEASGDWSAVTKGIADAAALAAKFR
ncbi:MAG: bifunctional 4-hydroxy-2-oxoglutarate aldolase/2-dehydro-3-deoxy-phosphogluconate aldolase [Lentisphaeria bacterium]|nr:bifunctional 4-hydroxy-2-oxoglutarate aldolase/2-dehydro-3-deoxy-phosphogluconate aldolase [Lentisphaeria bacterium]